MRSCGSKFIIIKKLITKFKLLILTTNSFISANSINYITKHRADSTNDNRQKCIHNNEDSQTCK